MRIKHELALEMLMTNMMIKNKLAFKLILHFSSNFAPFNKMLSLIEKYDIKQAYLSVREDGCIHLKNCVRGASADGTYYVEIVPRPPKNHYSARILVIGGTPPHSLLSNGLEYSRAGDSNYYESCDYNYDFEWPKQLIDAIIKSEQEEKSNV